MEWESFTAETCTQQKPLKPKAVRGGKGSPAQALLTRSHQKQGARMSGISIHTHPPLLEGGDLRVCLCTFEGKGGSF